ncbi:MAG TPA: hypothetical protein VM261_09520 [Kofleriaceae bacterium]|nr:hypothetical protein [Kofleriaceae bacterium]
MRWIACLAVALLACGKSDPASPAKVAGETPPPALGEDKQPPGEAACKNACAHRAECIPAASDQSACLADCSGLALLLGDKGTAAIEAYTAADCASAQKEEPDFQHASACLRGCKHVLECGVAGTFPGCMSECAQNLAKKAYSLEQLAAVTTADCATVKQSVRLSSAPADTSACDAACKNYDRCGVQPYAACMKECAEMSSDRLPRYAAASCEQLRSGDLGDLGFGCLREGAQDCQAGMMCCVAHRASLRGEQGQCLYAALCYHRGF